MKRILIFIIFIPLLTHSHDAITNAIKKSDPDLVKQEIKIQMLSNKPISKQEQLYYLDLCQEVITRRRNAIQFPNYYNGSAVYTPAFPSDSISKISPADLFTFIASLAGTLLSLPIGISIAQETRPPHDGLIMLSALTSEITCISVLIYIITKRQNELKYHQEELYENAIQIKHIVYEIPVT